MARKFLVPIDMTQLELLRARLQQSAGAPATPVPGQFWYDTGTGRFVYQGAGGALVPLISGADLAAGSVANTALATNPLDRANHTGTQLAATISDLVTAVTALRLDQFAAPTTTVSMGGQLLSDLAAAVAGTDATTLAQVNALIDLAVAGLDYKAAARMQATTNVALTGTQTIDGVVGAPGDRVLLTGQTAQAENGVWVMAAGAWARTTDADSAADLKDMAILVAEGGNAGTQWKLVTDNINLGATALVFVQHAAGGSAYSAGSGLTLAGNDFNVGAGNGILVTADTVTVDPAVVERHTAPALIGNGALTSIPVVHNFNNLGARATTWEVATGAQVECDVVNTNANTTTIGFAVAPAANAIRVVISG